MSFKRELAKHGINIHPKKCSQSCASSLGEIKSRLMKHDIYSFYVIVKPCSWPTADVMFEITYHIYLVYHTNS